MKLIEDGVQFILNPYDEWYGLVRAIELKEQHGGSVEVIHVGPVSSEILIRKALAIGADAAWRIDDDQPTAASVSSQIAAFAAEKSYDIIFTGKETIDFNGAEVGSQLAEYLNWPFVSYCNKLELEGQMARCRREIEGGAESIQVQLPFVLSAAKGLAEQRIPNMKGIIDAKKKPLEVVAKQSFAEQTELVRFELPPAKSGVRMVDPNHIDELVNIFKNELKII
ncbi:MAG TPA: electron transfer flavoprotein subunit beta/FixA family protein [Saprospiraceae bacterium]|nr:electron transfer flavoprotein subunit beta/FixA family protein [Saprospiraceae bacterium]